MLTDNERAQLEQTIMMFEVITQTQPLDYQSLEILKEAYSKLNREREVISTSKRIAQAYVQLGQLSSAILEYESILQRVPNDPDVQKALAEIERRATSVAAPVAETEFTGETTTVATKAVATELDDGKQSMSKLFVDGKLLSAGDFNNLWPAVNHDEKPAQVQDPFIQILHDKGLVPMEKSLKLLVDKSRLGYVPIEKYDVDIDLARSFPRDACLRWCVMPVDRMSKSVLVATVNPFNKQAARDLETATKNRLVWYLCSPAELTKLIKKVFR